MLGITDFWAFGVAVAVFLALPEAASADVAPALVDAGRIDPSMHPDHQIKGQSIFGAVLNSIS